MPNSDLLRKSKSTGDILSKTSSEITDTKADEPLSSNLTSVLSSYQWAVLGKGSYNRVWKSNFSKALVSGESYQGPWVLKYPISSDNPVIAAMNDKHRAVRVWNEINHSLPQAGLYKSGWVAPYLQNMREATDEECAQKTIQIYNETRRITLDAATKGNFLTHMDTGAVLLVDVDLAINRRKSLASMEFAKDLNRRFAPYWVDRELKNRMPKTLEVTRNLLYLEDYLSEQEINTLSKENLINVDNVLALTWGRTNRKKLTFDVFQSIAILTGTEIPISDVLIEALFIEERQSITPAHEQMVKKSASMLFFPSVSKVVTNDPTDMPEHALGS